MKRVIFIVAFIAFLTNAEAQYTIKKGLGDFNEIELSGASKVNLFQSDSNYIIIHSKDSVVKNLHVQIRAGMLYIMSGFKGDLYVKKVTLIKTTDASSIYSKDTLKTDNLTIHVSDAGKADVWVYAKTIKVRGNDASSVTLSGRADSIDVKASDASRINATNVRAQGVYAISSDGSSVNVWAVNNIDANATDGSSIHVKGSPKQKNTSASDGGAVTMDDSGEETTPEIGRHSMRRIFNDDSISGKKKSDHQYDEAFIGVGFVTGGNNAAPIKYGSSREFIIGLGGGYKLVKWNAIGWDVYYKSTGYYFTQNSSKSFPDTAKHASQKISLQNFGGLIYDRFILTSGYHGQLSLDLGFYFDWTFNSREVTWDNNPSSKTVNGDLSFVNPTNYGVTARLIFLRGLSCYFNYRLSNVFNYNDAPTLPACVFGITFGLGD